MSKVHLKFRAVNVQPWPYEEVIKYRVTSDIDLSGDYYPAAEVERLVEVTEALLIKCAENKGDITNSDFGKVWAALTALRGE